MLIAAVVILLFVVSTEVCRGNLGRMKQQYLTTRFCVSSLNYMLYSFKYQFYTSLSPNIYTQQKPQQKILQVIICITAIDCTYSKYLLTSPGYLTQQHFREISGFTLEEGQSSTGSHDGCEGNRCVLHLNPAKSEV